MSGNTATLTPTGNLPSNTTCAVTLTTAVRDVAGNMLASPVSFSFTTSAAADTTAPTVSALTPAAEASGVAINSSVSASFSEAMDPLSLTTASFSLDCPTGAAITGTVGTSNNGNTATFTPSNNLPAGVRCTTTLSTAVRDVAGNPLAAPLSSSFTTGAAADTTRPTVLSVTPAVAATNVATNTLVMATFSEAMDPASLSMASFTLACPVGSAITGSVGYAANGNVATFTPGNPLPPSTDCSAAIGTAARDLAGNTLASEFRWSFTTGATPDTTAPTVLSSNPADAAVGVCTNKNLHFSFSEAMDPLSITTETVTLVESGNGAAVAW